MKNFLLGALLLSVIGVNAFAQNANTSLSNLASPTKVNVNLLPNSDNKYTLGSSSKQWKGLYLSSAVYLSGLKFLSGGSTNTAVGVNALFLNTSGFDNTANGYDALFSNTDGAGNVAIGSYALYANTTGFSNIAIGSQALDYNSTGTGNIANGGSALYYNTTGTYNTAIGASAMYYNTYGYYNTAVGTSALLSTTGSQYNTAVGYSAGDTYDNGYNNVFLGANTDVNGTGYYNDVAIGQGTICTGVSQARIGNSSTVSIGGYANWTNISDGRVKKNIKQNVPGLAFINKLQPITYNLDLDAADRIVQRSAMKDKDGSVVAPSQQELDARKAKEQIVYTGFIAQDVEKAAKDLNFDFSGVDAAKNDKDLYGLRYSDFVVPLVKAVQELDASQKQEVKSESDEIAVLKATNNDQQKQIDELKATVAELQAAINNNGYARLQGSPLGGVEGATIEQNAPNPFSQNTTIQFYIPLSASNAMIVITDLSGKTIQQFNHLATGNGTITIAAGTLVSGTYQYSLVVDGKVIGTKQMVLTK